MPYFFIDIEALIQELRLVIIWPPKCGAISSKYGSSNTYRGETLSFLMKQSRLGSHL